MLFAAACSKEKAAIEYPAEGIYGPNILAEGRTSYPEDVQMEANLIQDNSVKIHITGITGYVRIDTVFGSNPPRTTSRLIGYWTMIGMNRHNLAISDFQQEPFFQTFQSIETSGKILVQMRFFKGHSYRLDIYENGASQPSRTKIIEIE
jgi:hypothetical protein